MPENPQDLPKRTERPLGPQDWLRDLVTDKPGTPLAGKPPVVPPVPAPAAAVPPVVPVPAPTDVKAPLVDATKPVTPVVTEKPVDQKPAVSAPVVDVTPATTPAPATPTPPPAQK